MTDTCADHTPSPADNNDDNSFSLSFWANKFKIPSFQHDPWCWNKEWENVLCMLSSKDVYPKMATFYNKDGWGSIELAEHSEGLKNLVCNIQNMLLWVWDKMDVDEHFITVWQLLEEEEWKQHLLKGLEHTCQHESWGQDSQALCPKITITSMLKQQGQVFILIRLGRRTSAGVLHIAF
jgi:hypothetical protein